MFNVHPGLLICFQEDLSEHVVQGDAHPGHVGTACLLSSSFLESGKDIGLVTLPIMGRNSRQTIGKVKGERRLRSRVPSSPRVCRTHTRNCASCPGSSGLPGYPAHPGAAVWHERLLRQVLEEEKHPGRWSQRSRQLLRSQVSQQPALRLQLVPRRLLIIISALARVCRHHRIRENTIASFKSAAKHVSYWRVSKCKICLFFFPLKKHLEPFSLQDVWQFGGNLFAQHFLKNQQKKCFRVTLQLWQCFWFDFDV